MHNPLATFTTRGCPNKCPFCAVPRIEGDLVELDERPVRPVVCDNNLLAASQGHFDHVIDQLKALPRVDFNQGLDAEAFTPHHACRIAELPSVKVRFAFDRLGDESNVADAIALARRHSLTDIGCYVLIGFNETPDEARYRLEKVREWGLWPNPMRYQPLDATEKGGYVHPDWTENELKRQMRYYSRLQFFGHIPYDEFTYRNPETPLFPDEGG